MFKVGDKVRVVSKTAEGYYRNIEEYLEQSIEKTCFYKKRGYFYITKIIPSGDFGRKNKEPIYTLNSMLNESGDYFSLKDLRHYENQMEFNF